MSAPRMVRCVECDRPLAIYGEEDPAPMCFRCTEIITNPLAAGPVANEKPRLPSLEQSAIDFESQR